MSEIWETVTRVSTPLMLSAFFLAIFFFLLRQVLSLKIFPRIEGRETASLMRQVIKSLTILAFITIILAFFAFIVQLVVPPKSDSLDKWEDRLVTINARNESANKVLHNIAKQIGVGLALGRGLEIRPITMSVEEARLSDVMDGICMTNNCTWEVLPKGKQPILFVRSLDNR